MPFNPNPLVQLDSCLAKWSIGCIKNCADLFNSIKMYVGRNFRNSSQTAWCMCNVGDKTKIFWFWFQLCIACIDSLCPPDGADVASCTQDQSTGIRSVHSIIIKHAKIIRFHAVYADCLCKIWILYFYSSIMFSFYRLGKFSNPNLL